MIEEVLVVLGALVRRLESVTDPVCIAETRKDMRVLE